jgi:hypothetical protein
MIWHAMALGLGIFAVNNPVAPSAEVVHVSNSFHFEVAAPMERGWAGKHWNPEFLYPRPAKDVQGAVFRVQHGPHTSVWVNTVFDLSGGRMQYVAFIDDVVVTTVDVKLASIDSSHTGVDVTYARTALQPAANDDVRAMGESDRESGPDWQKSIEKCLGPRR